MVTRVDHIDIRVANADLFVEDMQKLGFVIVRKTDRVPASYEIALPGENQVVFEVRGEEDAAKRGINHIAFKIDDLNTPDELEKVGVVFKKKHNFVKGTGRTVSNFKDRQGFSWQLTD